VAIVSCVVAAGCATSDDDAANAAPRGACPTAPVSVVVSVDQWGDIVDALAGDCGDVTTIFKSTSADPHDYEPTPADVARFSGADLVVVNGLDYDPWAAKAVATLDRRPAIVNGGDVVGLDAGDNPHIWYGPEYVDKVAAAVSAKLRDLAPEDASYFDQRHDAWRTSMHAYDELIAKIKPAAEGKTYGATEGIFDDMAVALGLTNETPAGYQKATANETDPAPGDIHEFEQALSGGRISVLVFNTQTEGSVPDQIRRQARAAKVPVVDVTESVPPKFKTFVDWQVHQLRDLEAALT
jgi:zinc/manganese transport system substrate-binding protein